jgi:hypothetical protein
VEALKMDDTPRARSKNLDVLAEFEKAETKNAANFVVIGTFSFSFFLFPRGFKADPG